MTFRKKDFSKDVFTLAPSTHFTGKEGTYFKVTNKKK